MEKAKNGDNVKVNYTGKLEDGTVFDSSMGREPLEFTVGAGQVIPGFDEAVVGMEPGESKTVGIPAQEAYGPYHEEMVMEVGREMFPPDIQPEVGQQLQVVQQDGQQYTVMVTEVDDKNVTLDANHPLAGQDLTFDIELVDIV